MIISEVLKAYGKVLHAHIFEVPVSVPVSGVTLGQGADLLLFFEKSLFDLCEGAPSQQQQWHPLSGMGRGHKDTAMNMKMERENKGSIKGNQGDTEQRIPDNTHCSKKVWKRASPFDNWDQWAAIFQRLTSSSEA